MKPTLLILAAGRGSRFGGAKQVTPLGPSGESIMEYSIYDALNNGFDQIVLVINKDIEQDTFNLVAKMTGAKDNISYAYQDLHIAMIPNDLQAKRLKPWGTAHAIMSAESLIGGNFAMINADDYYGASAFKTMADFLSTHTAPSDYSMVGYALSNTLSQNGTVSRGISLSNNEGKLTTIVETHGIYGKDNKIYCEGLNGNEVEISESLASMNFWGFQQNIFEILSRDFQLFLQSNADLTKDEFLIPTVMDQLIQKGIISTQVLHSNGKWFGVTYKEDQDFASQSLRQYVKARKYPNPLWQ